MTKRYCVICKKIKNFTKGLENSLICGQCYSGVDVKVIQLVGEIIKEELRKLEKNK